MLTYGGGELAMYADTVSELLSAVIPGYDELPSNENGDEAAFVARYEAAIELANLVQTRTLRRWRRQILAWHTTGVSNGPTEGLNVLIKKIKRIAAGFRNFAHYRLRLLRHAGGCNWARLGT